MRPWTIVANVHCRPEADSDGRQLSGSLLYGVNRVRTIIWLEPRLQQSSCGLVWYE
jgi:hypothetical protein